MTSRLKPVTALDVTRLGETAFVGGAPGLQCVVSDSGTKSWRLFYRLPGSLKRHSMTLGRYPGLSLADVTQPPDPGRLFGDSVRLSFWLGVGGQGPLSGALA